MSKNYSVKLTPNLINMSTEGSMDTSIVNAVSLQRTLNNIMLVNPDGNRKIVGKISDGGDFDNNIENYVRKVIYEKIDCSSILYPGSVVPLPDNSFIICGTFTGIMNLGNLTLTPSVYQGSYTFTAFIAKISNKGDVVWANKISNQSEEKFGFSYVDYIGKNLSVLSDGSIIWTGYILGSVKFGDILVEGFCFQSGDCNPAGFVAKLDPNGNYVWAKSIQAYSSVSQSSCILSDDSVILGGEFFSSAIFDNIILSSNDNINQSFIARMDSDGNFIWAKSVGRSKDTNIAKFADDSFVVSGYVDYDSNLVFGETTLSGANYGYYITRLDKNGNFLWAKRVDYALTSGGGYPHGIDINKESIFICGTFEDVTVSFDNFDLVGSEDSNVFVCKLNKNGDFIWAKQVVSTDYVDTSGLTALYDDSCAIVGYFQEDATFGETSLAGGYTTYIAKLDKDGNFIWIKQVGGDGYSYGVNINKFYDDYIVFTAYLDGEVQFGNNILDGKGMFVATIDENGNFPDKNPNLIYKI